MQSLLSQSQGKVMHTKTFIHKQTDGKTTAQIRCYFSYNKHNIKSKEEWYSFITDILGEYLDGPPSFVEMMPITAMKNPIINQSSNKQQHLQ
eukprot:403331541